MKINNFSRSFVPLAILASVISLAACSGSGTASSNTAPVTSSNENLSGLAYDPVAKAVFSVNREGGLCSLNATAIPGSIKCDISMPQGIILATQIASDGNGNIYGLGTQSTSSNTYLMKYQSQTGTWVVTNLQFPFLLTSNKLLYQANKLYIADPNLGTLYTINLADNSINTSSNFFSESPVLIEDFDSSGKLYYSYQTTSVTNFVPSSSSLVYSTSLSTPGSGTQFGAGGNSINDLAIVNNKIYACAESNFLYLPVGSSNTADWQVLTSQTQSGYFSCDYLTSDGSIIYYVEGVWTDAENFTNSYINKINSI